MMDQHKIKNGKDTWEMWADSMTQLAKAVTLKQSVPRSKIDNETNGKPEMFAQFNPCYRNNGYATNG